MHDASAFVGNWAFSLAPTITATDLIARLRAVGITGAAFAPIEAVLAPEPMAANRRLLAELAAGPESFVRVTLPILNPSLPGWEADFATCLEMGGPMVRGIKVTPNYHDYTLDSPSITALARRCAMQQIALCIQVRMGDERSHHPLMKVPAVPPAAVAEFAGRHDSLPILVCGAYMSELAAYREYPNVSAELSFVESGWLLRDALGFLGGDRLLLGTHAPLHMAAAGMAKLSSDELDDETYARISRRNFERIFSLR
jgi:predicted TIM-barrel fold metal-dependent hydrolase